MSEQGGTGSPRRYCANCGAEARQGHRFCASCGRLLTEGQANPGPIRAGKVMDKGAAQAAWPHRSTSRSGPSTPGPGMRGSHKFLIGIVVWLGLYLLLYAVSPALAVSAWILACFALLIAKGLKAGGPKAGRKDLSRGQATYLLGTFYLMNQQNERMREQREREQRYRESLQRRQPR